MGKRFSLGPRQKKENLLWHRPERCDEAVMAMEVWADTVYVTGLPKDVTEQR